MKQPVLSGGNGGRVSSPLVAARTRASRAAPPLKEVASPLPPPAAAAATAPRARRVVRVSGKEERAVVGAAAVPKRRKEAAAAEEMRRLRKEVAAEEEMRRLRKEEEMRRLRKEEAAEEEMRRLRGEVAALRKEVERLLGVNAELELQESGLAHQLTLAHCTITRLQQQQQDNQAEEAAMSQKSIQNDNPASKQQPPKPPSPPPPPPANRIAGGAPAPPPLPPRQGPRKTVNKETALVEMYNSLNKHDTRKAASASAAHHNSIVGELQNRSTHLLAIKADVETKGEFINGLINKVQATTYTDVELVLTFVDWLDQQLSTLSDETAVLKHFSWPERKADALREAAFEYRDLKCVLTDISSFNDDGSPTSCEATLRKISSLLDKLEKSMKRLVNLRSSAMASYKEFRIPTEWMLDSGIASKMKLASVKLAKVFMKRTLKEMNHKGDIGGEGKEAAALVAQSVRFTYRVHQFAGGLDSEAMHAFEELTKRARLKD